MMVLDVVLVNIAYYISLNLRFDVLPGIYSLPLRSNLYYVIVFFYSICLVTILALRHLYDINSRKRAASGNIFILLVNSIGCLGLMSVCYLMRINDISRVFLLFFWILSTAFLMIRRFLVITVSRSLRRKGYNQRHVVIVGNGKLARQYIQDVRENPELGITVDGYISAVEKQELGKNLGSYEELPEILQGRNYDALVVALEPHEVFFMPKVMEAAEREGIRLEMIPFFNEFYPSNPTFDLIGKSKVINLRSTPLDNIANAVLKRTMDIVGSAFLILLTGPIMLIIAIGVRLSSPGPVFFKQERVGLEKKPFMMLKFRSMRVNASEKTGWSTGDDPRKTKFGSFIRKYSLDELPQFFNVLVGQMSLVGPRPEVPYHVNHFKEEVPRYLIRQQVRPGMTGWAQVHGLRGDTSINDRVRYDIWYIENWSFWLDIKILLKTVFGGMVNQEQLANNTDTEKSVQRKG